MTIGDLKRLMNTLSDNIEISTVTLEEIGKDSKHFAVKDVEPNLGLNSDSEVKVNINITGEF